MVTEKKNECCNVLPQNTGLFWWRQKIQIVTKWCDVTGFIAIEIANHSSWTLVRRFC